MTPEFTAPRPGREQLLRAPRISQRGKEKMTTWLSFMVLDYENPSECERRSTDRKGKGPLEKTASWELK